VSSRFSAHHWNSLARGLAQARRVCRTGALALFADVVAPASALCDTHLQAVELLRDASHVRDYSAAEWTAALGQAGFAVAAILPGRLRMDFAEWTARMDTPADLAAAIRTLQQGAPREVQDHFAIEADGSFTIDTLLIEAVAKRGYPAAEGHSGWPRRGWPGSEGHQQGKGQPTHRGERPVGGVEYFARLVRALLHHGHGARHFVRRGCQGDEIGHAGQEHEPAGQAGIVQATHQAGNEHRHGDQANDDGQYHELRQGGGDIGLHRRSRGRDRCCCAPRRTPCSSCWPSAALRPPCRRSSAGSKGTAHRARIPGDCRGRSA
jgi:hypothetical protein